MNTLATMAALATVGTAGNEVVTLKPSTNVSGQARINLRRRAERDRRRVTGHNAGKRETMQLARDMGWRGKTYANAQRFFQALDRYGRAKRAARP